MNLRHLPRYSTDHRVLGITDNATPYGPPMPVFPHVADTGESGGGGGGTEDTEESTSEVEGSEADKYKAIAKNLERKLKSTPKPEQVEEWKKAAQELKEIRDGQRTESEKAVARAETAEKELAELKPKFLRLEVAYEKGLPPKLAARLVGATREELEADADSLLEEFGDAIKADAGRAEAKEKEKRTAAKRAQSQDAGVRSSRSDTKPSVSAGRDLYAERKNKSKTAA